MEKIGVLISILLVLIISISVQALSSVDAVKIASNYKMGGETATEPFKISYEEREYWTVSFYKQLTYQGMIAIDEDGKIVADEDILKKLFVIRNLLKITDPERVKNFIKIAVMFREYSEKFRQSSEMHKDELELFDAEKRMTENLKDGATFFEEIASLETSFINKPSYKGAEDLISKFDKISDVLKGIESDFGSIYSKLEEGKYRDYIKNSEDATYNKRVQIENEWEERKERLLQIEDDIKKLRERLGGSGLGGYSIINVTSFLWIIPLVIIAIFVKKRFGRKRLA